MNVLLMASGWKRALCCIVPYFRLLGKYAWLNGKYRALQGKYLWYKHISKVTKDYYRG